MSIYDILMLVVFGGAILFGMWKGLSWQIASLAAIIVSYFVAMTFRGQLAQYISVSEPWNRFAAMLILYLGTSLVVWMAYGYIRRTIDEYKLNGFDRQAGALLGALKGALLCMLVTLFAVSLFGNTFTEWVVQSKSGGYIASAINRLDGVIPSEIHVYLDDHFQRMNQNITKQDPEFLKKSKEKFDEKLKVFKGQWQLPQANAGSTENRPVENRSSFPPVGETSGGMPTRSPSPNGPRTANSFSDNLQQQFQETQTNLKKDLNQLQENVTDSVVNDVIEKGADWVKTKGKRIFLTRIKTNSPSKTNSSNQFIAPFNEAEIVHPAP